MDQGAFLSGLGSLARMTGAQTRSVCPENHSGERGGGARATTEGAAWKAAEHLGQGWKASPYYVIAPGDDFCLADIGGPGKIESIWFGGNVSRDYILRFYWDGSEIPAVETPLAEFFAYGWQTDNMGNTFSGPFSQLSSVPVAVNPNRGLNCFWPMPFRGRCRITLENRSDRQMPCYYQINYSLTEVPEDAGYFHAQYRQRVPLDYKEEYVLLDGVTGQGQYVGTAMFVGLNNAGNWWGEGEIKFYLDGDREFPTICGTGTEDYFGGSYDWEVEGEYVTYTTPYLGMYQIVRPDGLYSHQLRFSMYRWHVMDPIRFRQDLRVTIQDLGWTVPGEKYLARRDDIASVAYWYGGNPSLQTRTLPSREELFLV